MKGFFALGCVFLLAVSSAFCQPVIVSQPQNVTVNAGSVARLSVTATNSGSGALTYQWQLNGTNLTDGGDFSGSSTALLAISPVSLADAGSYRVIVSAGGVSVTNQTAAQVTVLQGTIVDFRLSGFAGGASNLVIELFDHDKPATVENFIHYITSGAYTNMFFDRLIPGFIIQGGDWGTSNRTSTTPGLSVVDNGIYSYYVLENPVPAPPLVAQVDSEFADGPFISNTYGTLAMALRAGNQNSASSAFFLNLADNSANLDVQAGGFCVFGRVLNAGNVTINGATAVNAGTNLLNYFNNTNFFSPPASGINQSLSEFPNLPVNYKGTNGPADDNLFYVDFTFLTNAANGEAGPAQPPIDTTPPTVSISNPTAGLFLTNGVDVMMSGTANDNVGLAMVTALLVPLNGANNSQTFSNIATGTTNWTHDFGYIPPGQYNAEAIAFDGFGNSATNIQPFTITAVLTNGSGTVNASNAFSGATVTNPVGGAFAQGQSYDITATAAPGWQFVNWTAGAVSSVLPTVQFALDTNFVLTANFIQDTFPGTLTVTSPADGSQLTNNTFNITGTLTGASSATLVLQLFNKSDGSATGQAVTNSIGSAWSIAVSNLALLQPGTYILHATAYDAQGRSVLVSETFTVTNPGLLPVITTQPQSQTVSAGSTATFSVSVLDTNGAVTYQWQLNGANLTEGGDYSGTTTRTLTVSPAALGDAGVYSVVVGSLDGAVTSGNAQLTVLQGTIINFQISGFAGGTSSNVVVELFDHDKPATVENFIHYVTSGAFDNMFFDRLVPGFVLQGGDWNSHDRTNSKPPVSVVDGGIFNYYVAALVIQNPSLPRQIDSEFNTGPLIHNTFGTIAMALQAGNQNSAANAFFFNLADNSANLDFQNGGFTVFGRVIEPGSITVGGTNLANAGTSVLSYFGNSNYFNTNLTGPPTSSINTNNASIPDLPVNFRGTNNPANTNLFYVDFTILTNTSGGVSGPAQPPVHTNHPSVAITSPTYGQVFTNGSTITAAGTASDAVGLAFVAPFMSPLNGALGNGPLGAPALGTTNWTLNFTQNYGTIPPGQYNMEATAQNGAGWVSTNTAIVPFTITAVLTNGSGTVSVTNLSNAQLNGNNGFGYAFVYGTPYAIRANPAAGQLFLNWNYGGNTVLSPTLNFTMSPGLLLTANFISNTIPGALAITTPTDKQLLTNGDVTLSGTLNTVTSAQVTATVFSASTGSQIGSSATVSGTTSWSAAITNLGTLPPGRYIVQAVARDPLGRSTAVTNGFTVMAKLNLVTNGSGSVTFGSSNPTYPYFVPGTYSAKATAKPGTTFLNWNDGVNASLNPTESFTITSNLTLTATFVSNNLPRGLAFTSPGPNAQVKQATFVAGKAPTGATNVSYQLFSQSTKLAIGPAVGVAPNGGSWNGALTNLAPGNYTAVAVATDSSGKTAAVTENFSLLAPLNITLNGSGTVTPAYNGQYLLVGRSYTVKAVPKAGQLFDSWGGVGTASAQQNPLTFTMTSNLSLTLNFVSNYFPNIQGTYSGLYYPTNASVFVTNSGYITLKVTPTGSFSGQFYDAGRPLSLGGQFLPDGTEELIGGGGGLLLIVHLSVDLTNGTGLLTGTITNAINNQVTWVANLLAYRGVSSLSAVTNSTGGVGAGNYVLGISGTPGAAASPPGSGYASVSLTSAGKVNLTGMLADNTSISESVGISKEGIFPVFASLYGAKGEVFGWQTNTSGTNFTGQVNWLKLTGTGTYYKSGFEITLDSSTDAYSPPVSGTQYLMTIGGGTLTTTLTNMLTVNAARQFVPASPNADNLHISAAAGTGVLSGQFVNPATGKTILFKGAFASPGVGGSGYTLDSNGQTGYIQIQAAPAGQ
jgi:cyclophilin family peptidyl-prolyl cis-trans isomerase